jgi:cullin 1
MAIYLSTKVLPALKEKSHGLLLPEFIRRADNHTIMNKWYSKFFMYLDRYHVKYQQLPTLHDAGMKKFKILIFDSVKHDVTSSILRLINDEREGLVIDKDIVKKCVQVYHRMGMGSLETYEYDFEKPFLDATK